MSLTSKKLISSVRKNAGKVTVVTVLISMLFMFASFLFGIGNDSGVEQVYADNADTSVNVTNIPPTWTVDAEEQSESSTSTPTNVDSNITWDGTGTEGNGEDYYLLICKSSTTPTARDLLPPQCNGLGEWAVSASTASGVEATATHTALDSDPEVGAWFAYICDSNNGDPKCNASVKTGTLAFNTESPWHANHRPGFTVLNNDGPTLPGAKVIWDAVTSDIDVADGQDQVQMFLCKAQDFTGTDCGPAGAWATSTLFTLLPIASTTLPAIIQDGPTTTYAYVIDEHGLTGSTTVPNLQDTGIDFNVENVAPSILVGDITLNNGNPLVVAVESGETTGFVIDMTITDQNSCVNQASGNEILSILADVYRSGVGSANCSTTLDYDTNNCYPEDVGSAVWNLSCSQRGGECTGPTDGQTIFDCTFPLWFNADSTDVTSEFPADLWEVAVSIGDDDYATSTRVVSTSKVALDLFMAYSVGTTTIAYGSLEPGFSNPNLDRETSIISVGNVGLDVLLEGTDMCTTYPNCLGNVSDTIYGTTTADGGQQYATSTVGFDATGSVWLDGTADELELNAPKTRATSTFASSSVYWAIEVPLAIAVSGGYTGVNSLIGKTGESADW